MKTFFYSSVLSCLLLGAILGAGFVSGTELISFFGLDNFLIYYILSCILLFAVLLFLFCFSNGKNFNVFEVINNDRFLKYGIYFSALVVSVCSLSAIEELFFSEVFPFSFPVYSTFFLILAFFICNKGIRCVEKVNFIIVPILIIITVVLIMKRGGYSSGVKNKPSLFKMLNVVLYVFLNVFSNVKIIIDGSKGISKKACVISALIIASTVLILGLLILSSLSFNKVNVLKLEIPLLFFSNNKFEKILLDTALFFAIFSSLIADLCPLFSLCKTKEKNENFYRITLLFLLIITLSMMKLSKIVKYFYPLVGAIGTVFFIKCIKKYIECIIVKKGVIMSKKNKIKKLTDEEYEQYIMSLKDEEPPYLIKKANK